MRRMRQLEEKILSPQRLGAFCVDKDTDEETILRMVYKDFSAKLDMLRKINPFLGERNSLLAYSLIKVFEFKMPENMIFSEYISYKDTFTDCEKAFKEHVFNVGRDFFGIGEWPIVLIEVYKGLNMGDSDCVAYTITR